MKTRLYTKFHDIELLKEVDNNGEIFTAEEHSYVSERSNVDMFQSKESLIYSYLAYGSRTRLHALGFIIDYMNTNGFLNILSLGAGQCVMEYLLRLGLPKNAHVVATDFDSFYISKATNFFHNIIPIKFDFIKDNVRQFHKKVGIDFDIAIFFGSAYVMDDLQFIGLFHELKEIGTKRIIDFHAGYIDWKAYVMNILSPLRKSREIRRLFRKPPLGKGHYQGKFHGYGRSRNELRKLYKLAGLDLIREASISDYKYVAICK